MSDHESGMVDAGLLIGTVSFSNAEGERRPLHRIIGEDHVVVKDCF